MIIFDTETSALTSPEAANINSQPRIIEFAAIKVHNDTLKEISRIESFIHPGISIPVDSVKITGITDKMVANAPRFASFYEELCEFFLGEDTLCAHNLAFDSSVMKYELTRIDRLTRFPWPPNQVCTVEATIGLKGYRLNLGKLHELATGKEHLDKHRAIADVEALATCVRWLRKNKML